MLISYPSRTTDVAELMINNKPVKYRIPPIIGTHQECFHGLSKDKSLRVAQGVEIVAYANGALVYSHNEWANQDLIRFPFRNYLWIPKVLTIIPKDRKRFRDLEGGMLVDSDLNGEEIMRQAEVPENLDGWIATEGRILSKGKRLFVPYNTWYTEQWDEKNGALIALCEGVEAAESLLRTSVDSRKNYRPLWKVDPSKITTPQKRVPVLVGYDSDRLVLSCDFHGEGRLGCAVGVLL